MTKLSPDSSTPWPSPRMRMGASVSGTCFTQTTTCMSSRCLPCVIRDAVDHTCAQRGLLERLPTRPAVTRPASSAGDPPLGLAQDLAGDHEALDLRRALVDLRDFGVPEVPLHRVILNIPIAAVDLHRLRRRPHGRLR